MRRFTSFKEFAAKQGLTEQAPVIDQNKVNIAKQALVISDLAGAPASGSMSREEAVKTLRQAGISDEQIKRLLITGGITGHEEISKLLA